MYAIIFFLVAIIGAFLEIYFNHVPVVNALLQWVLAMSVGVQGCYAFLGHFFYADEIAKKIGWSEGSPFQTEVSFTNLAFGVLGVLCFWLKGNFWLAVIIGRSIFLWGAAYTHIVDIIKNKNRSVYNTGIVLWFSGISMPIILIALLVLSRLSVF